MSALVWTQEFEIGLPLIDTQHQQLVEYINTLDSCLAGGPSSRVGAVALSLVDYARVHFTSEEDLMERCGFPGMADHRKLHADFLQTAMDAFRRIQKGDSSVGPQLLGYMQLWLRCHIMDKDKEIAASINQSSVAIDVASDPAPAPGVEGAKRSVDIMVVDDMANVPTRLRALLPAHLSMVSFTSAQAALVGSRDCSARVILVDASLPDVEARVLVNQLRALQPQAAFVALALRNNNDMQQAMMVKGFASTLFKPFTPKNCEDFVLEYFDRPELFTGESNVLRVASFPPREDYTVFLAAIEKVAEACFEDLIIDLSEAPADASRLGRLLVGISDSARALGLAVKVMAGSEIAKVLAAYEETKHIRVLPSVSHSPRRC